MGVVLPVVESVEEEGEVAHRCWIGGDREAGLRIALIPATVLTEEDAWRE